MFEFVKECGLQGWPAVAAIGIVAVCVTSLFCGWPWEGLIVHHHYYKDEDEEE